MNNYNLDTGKKYIKEVFAPERFYNVPDYQRPYVWQSEQIVTLLDDLSTAFDKDKNKEYFLGCMIWNTKKVKHKGTEYECQDILDGQQRFITLYLLHGVIRDLSSSTKLKQKVTERIKQEEDEFDKVPERNRIVFEIGEDRKFLEKHLLRPRGTSRKEELKKLAQSKKESISVKNMAKAILTIRNWWQKFAKEKEKEKVQDYIKRFFGYLSSNVLVLYLATPDNLDDAYNLFTVLNSRGLQLRFSDILKAQNLRLISTREQRREWATKWVNFEKDISVPFNGLDDFLWTLVLIKMKSRSDENYNLTKAFNSMWKKQLLKKGVDTFTFVENYMKHYEAIMSISRNKKTGRFFTNLNFLRTAVCGVSYMAPLLHYRECFGEYRILDFLIKLDNLLSLAWLTGKRVSMIQTRIFILLRRMQEFKENNKNTEKAANEFLESEYLQYGYQYEKSVAILNLEELYDYLNTEDWGVYLGARVNKTKYLLLKLDLLLGSVNTQLQFDKTESSIEHLMPRVLKTGEWNIKEEEHEAWLHKLGNLVLINKRRNSAMSNKSYSNKKTGYQSSIENRANTNHIFINYNEWNIDSIKNNHKRVLDLLKKYYEGNSIETMLNLKKEIINY